MGTVKIEKTPVFWLADPQEHDFPAAYDYLELLFVPAECKAFVDKLRGTSTIKKKSKDILRASALPLLPETNRHVKENLRKIIPHHEYPDPGTAFAISCLLRLLLLLIWLYRLE